jgi:transglutaminase-like putative cysteine protease
MGDYSINMLSINGNVMPLPSASSMKQTTITVVDSARNANAVVIGQKIGRDQSKLEFTAPFLTAEEWSNILSIFDDSFVNSVTYFDQQKGVKITREMYVNDRTAEPFAIDENGRVTVWKNCSFNLIDMGR